VRILPSDPPAATLALVSALALHETAGPRATIKWPNDLLIDGRKFAGILLERGDDAVVIGFGVNVAHEPKDMDRRVTSLAAHGFEGDAAVLLQHLSPALARWIARWRLNGVAAILPAWLAAAHPIGTALKVTLGDGDAVEGQFDGLDNSAALRLRLADDSIRAIHAGDVFLL